jgi:Fe-S cluster biosynthesis and repair protein YggX
MSRTVFCVKLQREAPGLERAPYPGPLGQRIFNEVSEEAWQGWIRLQTMLINEKRLALADAAARKYLAEQMEAHFFGTGAEAAEGYIPPR